MRSGAIITSMARSSGGRLRILAGRFIPERMPVNSSASQRLVGMSRLAQMRTRIDEEMPESCKGC